MNLMKKISRRVSLFWLTALAPVYAQVPPSVQDGIDEADTGGSDNLLDIVSTIIETLLLLVGILSVVMLIVGGIQYVTSAGSQDRVASAKNTIVYALLGLVIAILAYAIVNFITSQLDDGGATTLLRLV